MGLEEALKLVSVSLYGLEAKYLEGAVRLQRSVHQNLTGWALRIYHSTNVPASTLATLEARGAQLIEVHEPEDYRAMTWRFRAVNDTSLERILFRDTDSIITKREAAAIGAWELSSQDFHVIRDHPFHAQPIMGGLWGVTGKGAAFVARQLRSGSFENFYGADQKFLAEKIYPSILPELLVHATFHQHESHLASVPTEFKLYRLSGFCGESVTSNFSSRFYARFRRALSPTGCNCKI